MNTNGGKIVITSRILCNVAIRQFPPRQAYWSYMDTIRNFIHRVHKLWKTDQSNVVGTFFELVYVPSFMDGNIFLDHLKSLDRFIEASEFSFFIFVTIWVCSKVMVTNDHLRKCSCFIHVTMRSGNNISSVDQ